MTRPRTDGGLVTLGQASRELGVPRRRLYIARDRAELPVYQFGTPWCWVRLADAREWLERHRRPVASAAADSDAPCAPSLSAGSTEAAARVIPEDTPADATTARHSRVWEGRCRQDNRPARMTTRPSYSTTSPDL